MRSKRRLAILQWSHNLLGQLHTTSDSLDTPRLSDKMDQKNIGSKERIKKKRIEEVSRLLTSQTT